VFSGEPPTNLSQNNETSTPKRSNLKSGIMDFKKFCVEMYINAVKYEIPRDLNNFGISFYFYSGLII
jgi:hypothetical protein